MRIKSYFARTVEDAIALARQELGPDAMLVNSRKSTPESRHLGEYEVVFGSDAARIPADTSFPPAPGNGIPDRISAEIAELKKQLESMRRTLTRSTCTPPQWLGAAPALGEAYATLTGSDVDPELAHDIVQTAAAHVEGPAIRARSHESEWAAALVEELQSRFQVEAVLGTGAATPRIVALVGPPGAGKTTTLVKLAVNYGLAARRPVVLLSADTYRVAAAEQLRSYAAILGVGFQVLETVSALAQAIEENRGKELILIDTPGLGYADMDSAGDLVRFLSTRNDIDRQLVLSSSMKPADLTRVIDSYEIFQPRRLLFTRLDETSSLGAVFNEAVRTHKPLSFFANGQRIPEDLETVTAQRLIEHILGIRSEEALSAA